MAKVRKVTVRPNQTEDDRRRATMRDVADTAGVSLKTVSRVVNREPGVSEKLVRQVELAVATLGYQPDDRARFLRRSAPSSQTIGFLQVDVANPFFSSVLRGLEDVARANGSLVLAGSSDGDPAREEALIKTFISRRVDGLVLVSCHPDLGFLQTEAGLGTPMVFLDLDPPVDLGGVIRTDHYQGAVLATEHLLAHGHERIALLADATSYSSARLRLQGFQDTMAAAGLETPWLIEQVAHIEAAYGVTRRLLNSSPGSGPTALFTAQNFATTGAIQAIHDLGRQFDTALIGFDDIDLATVVNPPISVVRQQPRTLGRLAGEQIFERLVEHAEPDPLRLVPAELIPRGSGELPASPR